MTQPQHTFIMILMWKDKIVDDSGSGVAGLLRQAAHEHLQARPGDSGVTCEHELEETLRVRQNSVSKCFVLNRKLLFHLA